jgi:hypothetical protein
MKVLQGTGSYLPSCSYRRSVQRDCKSFGVVIIKISQLDELWTPDGYVLEKTLNILNLAV